MIKSQRLLDDPILSLQEGRIGLVLTSCDHIGMLVRILQLSFPDDRSSRALLNNPDINLTAIYTVGQRRSFWKSTVWKSNLGNNTVVIPVQIFSEILEIKKDHIPVWQMHAFCAVHTGMNDADVNKRFAKWFSGYNAKNDALMNEEIISLLCCFLKMSGCTIERFSPKVPEDSIGVCHYQKAIILTAARSAREEVYALLHEGGHWLSYKRWKALGRKEQPDTRIRELHAYYRGWQIIRELKIPVSKKEWRKFSELDQEYDEASGYL